MLPNDCKDLQFITIHTLSKVGSGKYVIVISNC